MLEMDEFSCESKSNSNCPEPDKSQYEKNNQTTSHKLPFTIKETNSLEILAEWKNYIMQHPRAHFFSHPLWLRALEEEYNRKAKILICQDSNGSIKGVLPLMPTLGLPFKKKELITSRRLSALPRSPLGGFLFDNKSVEQLLITKAIQKILEYKDLINLQLKSYSSELNNGFQELKKISWRPSFYLSLPDCPTKIRFGDKKHHRKVKWGVNKAISSGISIREAETQDDLKEWYKLYLETTRWHMVTARPFKFFKFLFENLVHNGLMKILLAENGNANEKKIIAGSIFFSLNDTVFYSFNGRNRTGLMNHANDLIQWQAIHDACKHGFKYYDMGEVSECNASLAQFKSKWGCESKPIYHYYFSSKSLDFNSGKLDFAGGTNIIKSVWRKLPLKVTQECGIFTNRFL